jgi:predicted transcriptional regulator
VAQVDRFSITMPPELGEGVRQAAARHGTSVSAWLTEAAADRLRTEMLGAALDEWEAEDGAFTATELEEATSRLGLSPRPDVA